MGQLLNLPARELFPMLVGKKFIVRQHPEIDSIDHVMTGVKVEIAVNSESSEGIKDISLFDCTINRNGVEENALIYFETDDNYAVELLD